MHRTFLLLLVVAVSVSAVQAQSEPPLLPWSQQIAVREQWLVKRHAMIPAMMRRQGVQMWIIVNEEFHNDPLTEFIAPPRPYAGNRDIFVFVDGGEAGFHKIAITGYAEENLKRFFESADDPLPQDQALAALYAKYRPAKIALSIGGSRGMTRSLTHDSYLFLAAKMGGDAEKHFVSAAGLTEEYLDTRIPEEFDTYTDMVEITRMLAHRALSNEVITPGKTTIGDVRRWLYDQLGMRGLTTWFQPDLRLQRRSAGEKKSRGFLAVAPEELVIERGDLLHVDFGFTYMGLNTDWQKMAYVLRDGETDVPQGLKQALSHTVTLQDTLVEVSRPDRTSAEVYKDLLDRMKQRGIEAMVYSHPLGNQGHGLGARIDFRSSKADSPEGQKQLRRGSYISIELNTATPVADWDGQKVYAMEEDPAYLTDQGWKFFVPRQESFYVIH
jgi:hypothetical protein